MLASKITEFDSNLNFDRVNGIELKSNLNFDRVNGIELKSNLNFDQVWRICESVHNLLLEM